MAGHHSRKSYIFGLFFNRRVAAYKVATQNNIKSQRIFKVLPKIDDGAIFRKQLRAKSCSLFLQKAPS